MSTTERMLRDTQADLFHKYLQPFSSDDNLYPSSQDY